MPNHTIAKPTGISQAEEAREPLMELSGPNLRDVRCDWICIPANRAMLKVPFVLRSRYETLSLVWNRRNNARKALAKILRCGPIGVHFSIERCKKPVIWTRSERLLCQIASDVGRAMRSTKS